jgi:ribonuclease Z
MQPGGRLRFGPVTVTAARLNHPQHCLGYRISLGERSIVYATDTEPLESGIDPAVLELARGAQLLIYDAQYTEAEYRGLAGRSHVGWGHSTIDQACRVASEAGVARLALFHHDPSHDDEFVEQMTAEGRTLFPNVFAAREGMCIEIPQAASKTNTDWSHRTHTLHQENQLPLL